MSRQGQTVDRTGETKLNNQGCEMVIIAYRGSLDIDVAFRGYEYIARNRRYDTFKNGEIKNPYYPSICGCGYCGDEYPITIDHKTTIEYSMWRDMFRRAYDEKYHKLHPTYENVIVLDEWYSYPRFYEWIHSQSNFDKLGKIDLCLDKDILIKGNKMYSSQTCTLVPPDVNRLFINRKNHRGKFLIGVHTNGYKKFRSVCNDPREKSGIKHIGYFNTELEAFSAYKKHKEEVIKYVANREFAAGNITEQCRDAMYRYQVEITD